MGYPSLAIANVFIDLARLAGKPLTNMKLQKLIYFADGHFLAHCNRDLVDDSPFAWEFGPVYFDVYQAYRRFGADPIVSPVEVDGASRLDDDAMGMIEAVWKVYGESSAAQLSRLSHLEDGPWFVARQRGRSEVIPREAMQVYFASLKKDSETKKSSQADVAAA